MSRLLVKNSIQRNYKKELNSLILDSILNLQSHYKRFPWRGVSKVKKFDIDSFSPITVNEKNYSTKEALKLIDDTQKSLKNKMKLSYYKPYISGFVNDSKRKSEVEIRKIYMEYKEKIDKEFYEAKEDLKFCLLLLKGVNKELKKVNANESVFNLEFDHRDVFTETSFESTIDIYYNKAKFENGKINICFVTGYSGSGKSSMTRGQDKKYAREVVDLDRIILFRNRSDDYYRNLGPFAISFMNGPGKKYRTNESDKKQQRTSSDSTLRKNMTRDIVSFARKYAKVNSRIKLILEGVYIYRYIKPQEIDDCAVYIKGTSLETSTERAIKRDTASAKEMRKSDKKDFHSDGKEKSKLQKGLIKSIKYAMASKDLLLRNLEEYQNYFYPLYIKQLQSGEKVNKIKGVANHIVRSKNDIYHRMKKESEDITMDYYDIEFFEAGYSVDDVKDIVIETYESFFDDDLFEEEEEITEGANLEYRNKFKALKKEYRVCVKEGKKALKSGNYAEARTKLAKMNTIMENVKKEIERNADSLPQKIIGNFIAIIQLFVEGLLIFALALVPIVGGIGSLIISIRESEKYAQGLNTMRKDILKDDEMTDTLAANNSYKTKLVGIITSYQRKLKVLDQKLEKAMKEQRKYEISVEKEKKLTAEAVEFEEKKAMLYEACSNGEITIQEREELLSELKEELFYTEETIDATISEENENLTKQEKFDKIKKELYRKCSDNEISVEEREDLINKAKEKIFSEATSTIPNMDSKGANMAGSKETKLQDTAMKATEKIVTGAVDKAAQTVQDNSQKEN